MFPSLVTVILTVRSGQQWKVIIELFKDAMAPITNLFLIVVVKDISAPSSWGE